MRKRLPRRAHSRTIEVVALMLLMNGNSIKHQLYQTSAATCYIHIEKFLFFKFLSLLNLRPRKCKLHSLFTDSLNVLQFFFYFVCKNKPPWSCHKLIVNIVYSFSQGFCEKKIEARNPNSKTSNKKKHVAHSSV